MEQSGHAARAGTAAAASAPELSGFGASVLLLAEEAHALASAAGRRGAGLRASLNSLESAVGAGDRALVVAASERLRTRVEEETRRRAAE